jgi:putative PIN family toxin of toxin-antitoxin system
VVISAALKTAGTSDLALLTARFHGTLALSRAVYAEYDDVLHRPKFEQKFGQGRIREVVDLLVLAARWEEPLEQVTDCRDPKDNCYLALAAEAGAECIISGDQDLLVLNPWRNIEILSPAEFVTPYRETARIELALDNLMRERYGRIAERDLLRKYRDMLFVRYLERAALRKRRSGHE